LAQTSSSATNCRRPCRAAILAGGLGTRLHTVTKGLPKPLAEVAGHPFIEFVLRQVGRAGIREVVVCAGHRADLVAETIGDGRRLGLSVSYSVERELLGTAGALKHAASGLGDAPFLVMNGDSFFDIPLEELFAFHASHEGMATIALARMTSTDRFGNVQIDARHRVTNFAEKPASGGSGLINAGIYVFGPAVLDLIPDRQPVSLEQDVFPQLIHSGLYGRPFDGFFVDIGVPSDYARLCADPERLIGAAN
jgi:NDP-sugar pyrophosphorylase family protein